VTEPLGTSLLSCFFGNKAGKQGRPRLFLPAAGGAFALLLAALLSLSLWAGHRERADVFAPAGPVVDDPGKRGLAWKSIDLGPDRGPALESWLLPGPGYYTVLWLHGNAVNMGDVLDRVEPLVKRFGATVMMVDYRGFGDSPGEPSESGLYADADEAMKFLIERRGITPERLVIYGHSLGGGVAVEMARRYKPAALVIESTFTSIPDMGRLSYPWLPVEWLVSSRFDNLAKIPGLSSRLLVIHGDADHKVPLEMGRRLYAAAHPPKAMLVVPGAGHSDCWKAGGEAYWEAWERVLGGT
jgi:uncharacterized protein